MWQILMTQRPSARRVNVTQSPYLHVFFNEHPFRLTIDTGAETNMIKASLASYIGASITKSSPQALQSNGHTPLTIVGETRLSLSRNDRTLTLEALVVKNLDVDILAGTLSWHVMTRCSTCHSRNPNCRL